MQSSLKSLFEGKIEKAELPEKRPRGRPKKPPDELDEPVQKKPVGHPSLRGP
jgi:hypothetical protein